MSISATSELSVIFIFNPHSILFFRLPFFVVLHFQSSLPSLPVG